MYIANVQNDLPYTTCHMSHVIVLPTYSWILYNRIYRKYSDRQAWANSVHPDETPQNAASHQDLHCLPLIQQFLNNNV